MHVALKMIHLSDNVHALLQGFTAIFAHPIGCVALSGLPSPGNLVFTITVHFGKAMV